MNTMRLLAAVVVTLALVGCKVSDSQNATAPTGAGSVRVAHAIPSAGNVDVYLDQVKILTNIAFGADTNLTGVPGGPHTIVVYPTGTTTTPDVTSVIHISNSINYDFIVAGGSAGGMQLIGGLNNTAGNQIATNAAVRVFDGIDSGDISPSDSTYTQVDVALNGASHSYTYAGLQEFGSNPSNTPPGYNDIAPDTYQVVVTSTRFPADTAAKGTLTLLAGQVRTLVVTSTPAPQGTPPGTILVLPDSI